VSAPVVRRAAPAAPKAHRARKAAAASAAPAVASKAKADQPARAVSEARLKPASQRATAAAPKARRATARGLSAAERPIDERVREAVVARLDSMKAIDLVQIDVRGKTTVTDYIVIATGTSTRHVQSMADEVVVAAKKLGMMPLGVEGEKEAEWVLVDLGDTVVHVMLPRTREFYALERLWTMAEESRVTSA
jgi:ribosome silencing factor RsfS/YbeB/iojap